jgi:hypothetical protein
MYQGLTACSGGTRLRRQQPEARPRGWTRADDLQHDRYWPAHSARRRAGLHRGLSPLIVPEGIFGLERVVIGLESRPTLSRNYYRLTQVM